MVLIMIITMGVIAGTALVAGSAAVATKLCLLRDGGREHSDQVSGSSQRGTAVVRRQQQRPRFSARGSASEGGLRRFLAQLPGLEGLGFELSAETFIRRSRRVLSFSPRIGAFRTAFVQALCNRYLPHVLSTISGMDTISTSHSATASLPVVVSHARGRGDARGTGAIGPVFQAENPVDVLSAKASFCPAMNLFISNALPLGTIGNYHNYPLVLRLSTGLGVGLMASELVRVGLTTGERSDALQMMPPPLDHEQLQLGGPITAPTAAAPDSTAAIGETSLTLTAIQPPGLRARRGRSPTRRRFSPPRRKSPSPSPRCASPSSGQGFPSAREEGIAGSTTISTASGGGTHSDGTDAIKPGAFGASFFNPPQSITSTAEIVRVVSLPYRGRQLARQIVQNRIDAPALLELISALTTESAAMKLQEMGMKYIGPPRPSSPSGLSTPCYYNLGLFSRKDGVGQEAGQPVCGSQGMSELMKSVSRIGQLGSNFVVCFGSKSDACAHAITGTLASATNPSSPSSADPPSGGGAGIITAAPAMPVFYAEEGDRAAKGTPSGLGGVRSVHINGKAIATTVVSVSDWVKAYGECADSMLYAWVWTDPATAAAAAAAATAAMTVVVAEATPAVSATMTASQMEGSALPSGKAMEVMAVAAVAAAVTATA